MPDTDELLEEIREEEGRIKKFKQWFRREFNCESRDNGLFCEIEGEVMKVPPSIAQQPYDEGGEKDMLRHVVKNHEVNKEAGIAPYEEIDKNE